MDLHWTSFDSFDFTTFFTSNCTCHTLLKLLIARASNKQLPSPIYYSRKINKKTKINPLLFDVHTKWKY